jgi:hypothetical protein
MARYNRFVYIGIFIGASILALAWWYAFVYVPPINVRSDTVLQYEFVNFEDPIRTKIVRIEGPLGDRIRKVLSQSPDWYGRNHGIGLNTGKYVKIPKEPNSFVVDGDRLFLMDNYGVRVWIINGVERDLDFLLHESE